MIGESSALARQAIATGERDRAARRVAEAEREAILIRTGEIIGELLDSCRERTEQIDRLEDDIARLTAENRELRRRLSHPATRAAAGDALIPARNETPGGGTDSLSLQANGATPGTATGGLSASVSELADDARGGSDPVRGRGGYES